jgi:hypothetical protein
MNILIVDDERPSRSELSRMLVKLGAQDPIREADSVESALSALRKQNADVVFLDIQMPVENGFRLISKLQNHFKKIAPKPAVILTTAHDQFAIQAFEADVTEYLLKPFGLERLAKALARVKASKVDCPKLSNGDSILLKLGRSSKLVPVEQIELFETKGNVTHVFWSNKTGKIHRTLTHLANQLDSKLFFRASRNTLLNLNRVISFNTNEMGFIVAMLQSKRVRVFSRRQSQLFRNHTSL